MASRTGVAAKTTTISLRTNERDLAVIDRAATATGRSRTDFMMDASRREAEGLLLDRVYFQLDDGAFAEFEGLVESTPEPSVALRALLEKGAPWERPRSH